MKFRRWAPLVAVVICWYILMNIFTLAYIFSTPIVEFMNRNSVTENE